MKQKLDVAWLGLLVGLIIPLFCGYIFLKTNELNNGSIKSMLAIMSTSSNIIKFLCIAIFPNMAGVFLLNTLEMWHACRGVFASIFIYVAVALMFLLKNM